MGKIRTWIPISGGAFVGEGVDISDSIRRADRGGICVSCHDFDVE